MILSRSQFVGAFKKYDLIVQDTMFSSNATIKNILYPITTDCVCVLCVLCTKPLPYPHYYNYLFAINTNLWITYFVTIFTSALVTWLIQRRDFNAFFWYIIELMQLTVNKSSNINYMWSFAGLIIINCYLAVLTSLLAEPIYPPSIRSIDQIKTFRKTVFVEKNFLSFFTEEGREASFGRIHVLPESAYFLNFYLIKLHIVDAF